MACYIRLAFSSVSGPCGGRWHGTHEAQSNGKAEYTRSHKVGRAMGSRCPDSCQCSRTLPGSLCPSCPAAISRPPRYPLCEPSLLVGRLLVLPSGQNMVSADDPMDGGMAMVSAFLGAWRTPIPRTCPSHKSANGSAYCSPAEKPAACALYISRGFYSYWERNSTFWQSTVLVGTARP